MSFFDAVIYGIIQGLSEFLPISSSGHLALLPYVMNIKDPGVVFDLTMHLGTALAVLTYFRQDIMRYVKILSFSLVDFKVGGEERWFVRNFIFSTLMSLFFILLFLPVARHARDPMVIIFNLSVFGALLWFSDWKNARSSELLHAPLTSSFQWRIAGLIGFAQALAIFPGVSRSGITLTMSLLIGMKREEAGHYSFLLSLPIILAGMAKEVPHIVSGAGGIPLPLALTGVVTSFLVGLGTIHFFLRILGRIGLIHFALYRWFIAGLMAVVLYYR